VIEALARFGVDDLSPEARTAAAAFRDVEERLAEELAACASGRELVDAGFEGDVEVASELDVSDVVPVLRGEVFTAD
jgi:2-phosphosulfolactate phosphatase